MPTFQGEKCCEMTNSQEFHYCNPIANREKCHLFLFGRLTAVLFFLPSMYLVTSILDGIKCGVKHTLVNKGGFCTLCCAVHQMSSQWTEKSFCTKKLPYRIHSNSSALGVGKTSNCIKMIGPKSDSKYFKEPDKCKYKASLSYHHGFLIHKSISPTFVYQELDDRGGER